MKTAHGCVDGGWPAAGQPPTLLCQQRTLRVRRRITMRKTALSSL